MVLIPMADASASGSVGVVVISDYEFTMSLGLRHPDIDPESITRALALQPEHVWRKGEERRDESGAALGGERRESYWVCEFAAGAALKGERADVESELSRILHTLRRSMDFMQHLQHGGGAAELFVSVYTRKDFRISLLAEEASLLGRLGVGITIEIRPHAAGSTGPIRS